MIRLAASQEELLRSKEDESRKEARQLQPSIEEESTEQEARKAKEVYAQRKKAKEKEEMRRLELEARGIAELVT